MNLEPQFEFAAIDSNNPIDTLEAIARENKWPLEKMSDDEASLECVGRWGQFMMYFAWDEEFQSLEFSCVSSLTVPADKESAVKDMLYHINNKVWLGHFCVNEAERSLMFRYNSLMRGYNMNGQEHLEDLIELAMAEIDRFYPALKAAVHERKVANDIMVMMLADSAGEA